MTSMIGRCFRVLIWAIVFIIVLGACGEEYLKLKGYRLSNVDTDPVFGWSNSCLSYVSDEDPTVTENSVIEETTRCKQRCSHPDPQRETPFRAAVFGDSYTYGAGVRDEDTFCWKLNGIFPNCRFDNYGVGGYGPYQCYLTMRHVLSKLHYDLVIYPVWTGHIERNVPSKMRWFNAFSPAPWVELQNGRLVEHTPKAGYEWTRRFRILSFIKRAVYGITAMNDMPDDEYNMHVFTLLLKRMNDEAKRYGIPFVCFLLNNNRYAFIDDDSLWSIRIADIHIDELKNSNTKKYRVRHRPRFHPNAEAHSIWTQRIAEYIKAQKLIPEGRTQPKDAGRCFVLKKSSS